MPTAQPTITLLLEDDEDDAPSLEDVSAGAAAVLVRYTVEAAPLVGFPTTEVITVVASAAEDWEVSFVEDEVERSARVDTGFDVDVAAGAGLVSDAELVAGAALVAVTDPMPVGSAPVAIGGP